MIEANIHPEPIPARVMRQVASGTLDEARLLPAPDGLAGFDALIQHALSNPVPLPQRQDRP